MKFFVSFIGVLGTAGATTGGTLRSRHNGGNPNALVPLSGNPHQGLAQQGAALRNALPPLLALTRQFWVVRALVSADLKLRLWLIWSDIVVYY